MNTFAITIITIITIIIIYYVNSCQKPKILYAETDHLTTLTSTNGFYNHNLFPFTKILEHNWKGIQKEAVQLLRHMRYRNDIIRDTSEKQVLANFSLLDSYLKDNDGWFPHMEKENDPNRDWWAYPIVFNGQPVKGKTKEYLPFTLSCISQLPDRILTVGFSLVKPNGTIPVHTDGTGMSTQSLAFNMGLTGKGILIVDNGDNGKYYKYHLPGEMFCFSSDIPHYGKNLSNEDRIILYFSYKL